MLTPRQEILFDRVTRSMGGILQYTDADSYFLDSDLQNYVDTIRHHIAASPPIHFGLINNNSLNACAFRTDNLYFIGLNLGSAQILRRLFNTILANRQLLPQIGNASLEEDAGQITPSIADDQRAPRIALKELPQHTLPKCDRRRRFAKDATWFALRFLIAHEAGHILNGHVDWLRSNFNAEVVEEIMKSTPLGPEMKAMQSLELDADLFAVEQMLMSVEHSSLSTEVSFDLECWTFSISILINLFGDMGIAYDNLTRVAHPVPRIRQLCILNAAEQFAKGEQRLTLHFNNANLAIRAQSEAESALATATEFYTTPSVISHQDIQIALDHIWATTRFFRTIHPHLRGYAFRNTSLQPADDPLKIPR